MVPCSPLFFALLALSHTGNLGESSWAQSIFRKIPSPPFFLRSRLFCAKLPLFRRPHAHSTTRTCSYTCTGHCPACRFFCSRSSCGQRGGCTCCTRPPSTWHTGRRRGRRAR